MQHSCLFFLEWINNIVNERYLLIVLKKKTLFDNGINNKT